MKISVIVPVYNTQQYLVKCLDSLLNQTLKELEIIVVNDGSTDDSQEIINQYINKDTRIKSIQKENGGLSDARNVGIEKATGEYLAFVDSDDFVDEQMLNKMYNLAKKHNAEIVLCDLEKVNEQGIAFRDLPQSPQLPEKIDLRKDFTLFGEMSCFACNKIFKKELFNKHRFKKGIHFEDIELIPKLIIDSNIIAKINEPFYKYFERQNSISKTHTIKGLDMFLAIDNVTEYVKKSIYKNEKKSIKRFQILQAYYSYLAYLAYVKETSVKQKMLKTLAFKMKEYGIHKKEIIQYKRYNVNYFFTLPVRKKLYYIISLFNLKILNYI